MTAFTPDLSRGIALRRATQAFAGRGIDTAASDARFLVLDILGLTPTNLVLAGDEAIGRDGALRLNDAVERRLAGEPVARIVGAWEFWGLPFALSPETLVPRPDTETVVEAALGVHPRGDRPLRLLDLGTGSGCILVALLTERQASTGIGLDRSYGALVTARANAVTNGVGDRSLFVQGDWASALRGPFDLIVSNPPYIPRSVIAGLAVEVRRHDPVAALDGGDDGLDSYRLILGQVAGEPGLLADEGALLFEVGYDQAAAVVGLGRAAGLREAAVVHDLAGHARVVRLTRSRVRDRIEKGLVADRSNR